MPIESTVTSTRLPGGRLSNAQRPLKAAVLTLLGGGLVAWVPLSLLPASFLAGSRSSMVFLGLTIGLLVVALGLFLLAYPHASVGIGALVVVLSIVAFPATLGGLLVGSVLGICGGASAVAWRPAPQGSVLEVRPGGVIRRAEAFAVDLVVFVTTYGLAAGLAFSDEVQTWPGFAAVVGLSWAAVNLPGTVVAGGSPGKLAADLRVVGPGGQPPGLVRTLVREVLRLVAVATVVGAVTAAVRGDRRGVHDLVAGTRVVHRQVVPAATGEEEDVVLDLRDDRGPDEDDEHADGVVDLTDPSRVATGP